MDSNTRTLVLTRRDLLRAGMLAAAAATVPLLAEAGRPSGVTVAPLRVGALLPRSAAYPQLGESLLAGLQLYFAQQVTRPLALQTHLLAPGTGAIGAAVDELQARGPLDVILGMVTPSVAAQLHERLAAAGTVFVNATVGANIPREADHSAHVLHASLAHWEASWALGRWAARQLGTRGLVATSLYDSGYDALYAFRLGFEGAGGTILATQISHTGGGDTGAATIAALREAEADFVYAAYSGQPATDFVRAYARAGLAARLPLIGGSFLTDEGILPVLGDAALGIRTASTWSPDLDRTGHGRFGAVYRAQTGRAPDILAALGFDAARVIDLAVGASGATASTPSRAAGLVVGLAMGHELSPRGALTLDPVTRVASGPVYLREVRATATGPSNAVIAALPGPNTADSALVALRRSPKTGWTTPYLGG